MSEAPAPARHWLGSYHAVIVFSAMALLLISNGMVLSGLGPFRNPLIAEFGWTARQIALGDTLTFMLLAVFAPLIGVVIDRFGTRGPFLLGMTVLALGYYAYGEIDSLSDLYLIHVSFSVVLALAGLVPTVALVSRWFDQSRGTAIGIALVGSSLASFVFPPLAERWLIPTYGWREAFQWLSLAAVLGFLLTLLLVRSRPADRGLSAYGVTRTPGPVDALLPGLSVPEALRTWTFWILAASAFLTFFAMLGTLYQLPIYLKSLGVPQVSAGYMAMLGAALIGKFVFGWAADALGPKRVFIANLGVMALGAGCLALTGAGQVLWALALYGLGWGGLYTMLQLLTVQSFGLRSTGKIMGLIAIFDCLGGGLGSYVMAAIFDAQGSYAPAFWLLTGMIVSAMLAATRIKPEFDPGRVAPAPMAPGREPSTRSSPGQA